MNARWHASSACGVVVIGLSLAAQSSGPDTRQITDPRTLTSDSSPTARPIPIDDLYFTRSLGGAAWSPDGKDILFTTNIASRMNLWRVSASGGWPIQLSQSDERQFSGTWSPDGKWIAYQQDTAGNELWDLFAIPRDGGASVNLTATPDVREEAPHWSPDGKTIAFNRKPKQSTVYDVALLDWTTRKITQLTHETTKNHLWQTVAWSPDGRVLYANRLDVSFQDAEVYSIEVATGKATNLTPHQGQTLYIASSLSPDGKTLLVTSNARGGYQNVALLTLPSQPLKWVTDTKWEATAGDFSPNGKSFTYAINADGRTDLFLADAATGDAKRMALAAGMNGFAGYPNSFSPSGDRLLVSHKSSVDPSDYWVHDVASGLGSQLTYSAIASLTSAPRPASRVVSYKIVRRQDDQRVDVDAVQSQAQRDESGDRSSPWRTDRPDGGLLESA